MTNIPKLFGCNVFNNDVMKTMLPKDTYYALKNTINRGLALDAGVANAVASAMKDWAVARGVTHFTHWFQPMTGITAEKHDSFITPSKNGRVIMEFSGKELIKGESDASSFPSGGLRATFEARGYTAWDPTSYAFIKDGTLCIPTVFCSFSGEVLDKKTPLLRSCEAINKQTLRLLHALGSEATRVLSEVGAEQEYFLIDKTLYDKRRDLKFTGRTLFGAPPPKGQEMENHYYGNLKERISNYMHELDLELWKLGICAKTKHNEAAPAQHEFAPVYTNANTAADQNQLAMEVMKKVASHHGLVCLLHEKPFAGVNGSGKHNNWSLGDNVNGGLFKPGKNMENNLQFLLFVSGIVKAVDIHADLIRVSVAIPGNDHRLGADEAPPGIMSVFLGEQLTKILYSIADGMEFENIGNGYLNTGVDSVPSFLRDNSDRNRTSPVAFTGNKFEFRMPGSSQSVSGVNFIINTAVADAFGEFADRLEKCKDKDTEIKKIIKDTIKNHGRVIFNGNSYSQEWKTEAKKRGLPDFDNCVDALTTFVDEKNIALFEKHGVLCSTEIHSRYEILLDSYSQTLDIEAATMIEMIRQEIYPAAVKYTDFLANSIYNKQRLDIDINLKSEKELLLELARLSDDLYHETNQLESELLKVKDKQVPLERAEFYRDRIFIRANTIRKISDNLERKISSDVWPFPTYSKLLFDI